jgi:hypothetical protein
MLRLLILKAMLNIQLIFGSCVPDALIQPTANAFLPISLGGLVWSHPYFRVRVGSHDIGVSLRWR